LPALLTTLDPAACAVCFMFFHPGSDLSESDEKAHITGTLGIRHWTWIYRRRLLRLVSLSHFSVSGFSILPET
jgi:hypothetical protein